jgi:hypothetical protein
MRVIFDGIEWDENNLAHACRRVTAAEIEQVIANATTYRRHQHHPDRVLFTDRTDGGKVRDRRRTLRHRLPSHPADLRMGGVMTEPGPGSTEAELADYYDRHRDLTDWSGPQPIQKSERLDVTISVRFTPAEIATIRTRAEAAGLKPTAYIRRCALATEQPPIDREQLRRTVAALSRDLEDLRRTAG